MCACVCALVCICVPVYAYVCVMNQMEGDKDVGPGFGDLEEGAEPQEGLV